MGVLIFDAERVGGYVMPIAQDDPDELNLVDEVNKLQRELYAAEEGARGARMAFWSRKGMRQLVAEDHDYLDAVSDRVNNIRVDLRRAELALQAYREARRKAEAEFQALEDLDDEELEEEAPQQP